MMSRGLITIIKEQGVVPEALTTASGPLRQFPPTQQFGRFQRAADMGWARSQNRVYESCHLFGTGLPDADKRALIAFVKRL